MKVAGQFIAWNRAIPTRSVGYGMRGCPGRCSPLKTDRTQVCKDALPRNDERCELPPITPFPTGRIFVSTHSRQ